MKRQMKSQGTRNFWKLKLRKETHEFVPKFLAMLKVARNKYPEMYFQGAPRVFEISSTDSDNWILPKQPEGLT